MQNDSNDNAIHAKALLPLLLNHVKNVLFKFKYVTGCKIKSFLQAASIKGLRFAETYISKCALQFGICHFSVMAPSLGHLSGRLRASFSKH